MTVFGTFEAVLAITYQEDVLEICRSKYFQYVVLVICGLGRHLFGICGLGRHLFGFEGIMCDDV